MIKVAGYCRVSTDSEDQMNSFQSQKMFFRDYIQQHPEWDLYEIYADEGISGTSTKKRVQFNRMINDAYRGKFKMIITKEVSRFSRNLLDTIAYTRELKAFGVGVIFMNDGFTSLDPDSELRLSIMASIAQEESRKTSSRVKWGQTRRMEKGVVFGTSLLGYTVRGGELFVDPEGAEIVRLIFHKYGIERKGASIIARELEAAGYKTVKGNSIWRSSYIMKILHNEKYVGDLIQKKTITPDYLSHEKKYNKGQEQLVVINNHHEPLIDRALWDTVQQEIQNRNRKCSSSGHTNRYIFSGKIICGACNGKFVSRRKNRGDGTSYMRWNCSTATTNGSAKVDSMGNRSGCDIGKVIRNDLLLEALTEAIKSIPIDFDWIIRNVTKIVLDAIRAGGVAEDDAGRLRKQIRQIVKKKEIAETSFTSNTITQEEFIYIKRLCDEKITALESRLEISNANQDVSQPEFQKEIQAAIESIVRCTNVAESFYKALLEKVVIQKNGTFLITMNRLPQVWHYELQYYNTAHGCQKDYAVPMSVSRPFNSSKGML